MTDRQLPTLKQGTDNDDYIKQRVLLNIYSLTYYSNYVFTGSGTIKIMTEQKCLYKGKYNFLMKLTAKSRQTGNVYCITVNTTLRSYGITGRGAESASLGIRRNNSLSIVV